MFRKYYNYLLQISELCAEGYILDNSDRNFFKNSTQSEVDRFINFVRKNRFKKIDYNSTKFNKGDFKWNRHSVLTKRN